MGKKISHKLKIIPLGGLNEIGKNMTAFEYNNEILIIDCGLSFPSEEMLGIDVVIQDITYLKKNEEKVKGIVFTHGHEDHIGSVPYFLKEINVPLYGTKLTLGLINVKIKDKKNLGKVEMIVKEPGQAFKVGCFGVEFIRVSHSIPDAVSVVLTTPFGKIVYTGDFKIDYTPIDGQAIDLGRFAELGNEGVTLLMAESTNVEREGYTMSESTVGITFDNIFRASTTRIIVASFASNIHRVQQIVNAAQMNDRKVCFSGRSMVNVSEVAKELGYLKINEDTLIDIKDLDRYPDNEIVLVTTGTQGEPMAALSRMAKGEHRNVQIREGDLVIFSSSPIPGNEKSIKNVINLLYQKGAEVIYEALADVHVSGHACKEELKLIHALVKPKYFIPIHGEYSHLKTHSELAHQMGIPNENIFVLSNGNTLEITQNGAKMGKNVPSGKLLIDGLGIGDVGNIVLRDRKILSEDGLMVVVVSVNKSTNTIVSGPDIISRGFVYVRESEELMLGAKKVVKESLTNCLDNNIKDWASLKSAIRNSLREFLYRTTKRSPMILPVIMEV
ncbi:ribonuclease J [Helicovermis profundi]|uniref:Ribonuclease J n=1 Tax=Helicovermis profundi TaxID=3065157 RepID=A0AAU9EC94_9FIRM|nr:ribonuclease J [Clostridia bacterium S502]